MGELLNDISVLGEARVVEDSTEVDGVHVLAKVKGVFFSPDGESRNKRFYSRSLWEKQLSRSKIQEKLQNKTMLGTVSHDQALNDLAVLEGKVTHIVTNLYIDENNQGIGEALILNTPSGQVLNTLGRAGVKLHVSSRALGAYKGKKGDLDIVDPNSYDLETFDFVLDPGFLEASPQLVEQLVEQLKTEQTEENPTMDEDQKQLLESIITEKNGIQTQLGEVLDTVKDLEGKNAVLEGKLTESTETATAGAAQITEETDKVVALTEALKEAKETLESYEAIGTVEAVQECLEQFNKLVESVGTPKEIQESIEKSVKVVESYQAIGTVEEIQEALDKASVYVTEIQEAEKKANVAALAKELGIKVEDINHFGADRSEDEIRAFFLSMMESMELKNKYKKPLEENNEDPADKGDKGTLAEKFKPTASSLIASFGR